MQRWPQAEEEPACQENGAAEESYLATTQHVADEPPHKTGGDGGVQVAGGWVRIAGGQEECISPSQEAVAKSSTIPCSTTWGRATNHPHLSSPPTCGIRLEGSAILLPTPMAIRPPVRAAHTSIVHSKLTMVDYITWFLFSILSIVTS